MSNKEAVIEALRDLPEEASFEAIIEHLLTLAAIRRGEEDADAGRVVPHDEIKKRIASWITK
jgi:predicted transcriptional regulator